MESGGKIIVILGPTSSGKSDIAIKLAQKFSGEIISADSRQIYRGLDVGTGKVTGSFKPVILSKRSASKDLIFMSESIPHYMIDIVSPRTIFSAAQFKKKADKIIASILKRGKVPIICGGTGFWIKAVVDNVTYPGVKPDWKLRKKLGKKSITELIQELKKLDPERAKNIDAKNPARLIRAIEICKAIDKVPALQRFDLKESKSISEVEPREFLQIGISIPKKKLHKNIKKRLDKRWQQGMIAEVQKLKKTGLSWKKIQSFGLGYFWIPLYLQSKLSKEELYEKVYLAEKDYAKRQMTWFQKDKRIKWLKKYSAVENEIKIFIKKS